MSRKRKNVRFAEGSENDARDDEPNDQELLRMSAKRRLGDETMSSGASGSHSRQHSTYDDIGPGSGFLDDEEFPKMHGPGQHTLDSDEEDDAEKDNNDQRLDVDNVEGQEDTTIDFDEETKITPFNMKEELEEGFYDSAGNFVFDRKKQDIKDAWLDNIDWSSVKKDAGDLWDEGKDEEPEVDEGEGELSSSANHAAEKLDMYRKIVGFMRPAESVTRALKRLGGNKSATESRRERWKCKRLTAGKTTALANDEAENVGRDGSRGQETAAADHSTSTDSLPADPVTELTGLVDRLVGSGEFEIYGWTFEKFNYEIEQLEKARKFAEHLTTVARITDEDAELDMFAENVDKTKLTAKTEVARNDKVTQENYSGAVGSALDSGQVLWEFRWTNEPTEQIYGPFSSSQMQKWAEDEYFKEGVWTRRVDQPNAQFYSSKRIDFDLYT